MNFPRWIDTMKSSVALSFPDAEQISSVSETATSPPPHETSEIYSVSGKLTTREDLVWSQNLNRILTRAFISAGIPQPSTQYRIANTTEPSVPAEKGEWKNGH
jgi:hypothetical protein